MRAIALSDHYYVCFAVSKSQTKRGFRTAIKYRLFKQIEDVAFLTTFSDQVGKIIICYKRIGYNRNIMLSG